MDYEVIVRAKCTQTVLFIKHLGKDVTVVLHNNGKKVTLKMTSFVAAGVGYVRAEPVLTRWETTWRGCLLVPAFLMRFVFQ